MSDQVVDFFGMQYEVPVVSHWQGTVIAVNVGGAVIPTLMSLYLLVKRDLWVKGTIATAIVALVLHWLANPVPGLGIAVPVFVPVVTTAVVALLLSRRDAAPLAYIAGSLGTLIGADLTNLDKVRGLGAPVASIGGAGTFDGIFLTGILAVLIANLYAGPRQAAARITATTLGAAMPTTPLDAITDYHVHVYYDPAQEPRPRRALARTRRRRISASQARPLARRTGRTASAIDVSDRVSDRDAGRLRAVADAQPRRPDRSPASRDRRRSSPITARMRPGSAPCCRCGSRCFKKS